MAKVPSDRDFLNISTDLSLNLERRWDAGLPTVTLGEQFHLWNGEQGNSLSQGPYKGISLPLFINHQTSLRHLSISTEFLRFPPNVCPSEQIHSFSEEGTKLKGINYFRKKNEWSGLWEEVAKMGGNIPVNIWAIVGQKFKFKILMKIK